MPQPSDSAVKPIDRVQQHALALLTVATQHRDDAQLELRGGDPPRVVEQAEEPVALQRERIHAVDIVDVERHQPAKEQRVGQLVLVAQFHPDRERFFVIARRAARSRPSFLPAPRSR